MDNIKKDIFNFIKNNLLAIAGMMFFVGSFAFFMGITMGEVYYPSYSIKNDQICQLAINPQTHQIPQPSATIYASTMIITGFIKIVGAWLMYLAIKKRFISLTLTLHGLGMIVIAIIPGNISPWHFYISVLTYIIGGIYTTALYTVVKSPLRYAFLFFGIVALISLASFYSLIPIIGSGGATTWIYYPHVFCLMGFGAYLLGVKNPDVLK